VSAAEDAAAGVPATSGRGVGNRLRIRQEISLVPKVVLGIIPVVVLVAVWVLLTSGAAEERVISPLILPAPLEVLRSFRSLWFEAELSRSIVASAWRVIRGFVAALVVALPLGIAMGAFTRIRALFEPLSIFGSYLPIPALVPLTMSLFGIGEVQKVMFLGPAFLIYLIPTFVKAVDSVQNVYLQTAYTMGVSQAQAVGKVMIPIAAPAIVQGMRLGFGIGWTYIILAEMVAADRGLGQIIIVAQRRGPREHIYLVLLVIVLIAYLADRLWVALARGLFPYQETK
jgi:ABC-type nitrate/sulfonate/bicarbonate transport system permease component